MTTTLPLVIDALDMDPGSAFLHLDYLKRGAVRDARIDGRFTRQDDGRVCLELYSSADLGHTGEPFDGVCVIASSRRAAIVKALRALGYPRGTAFTIRHER